MERWKQAAKERHLPFAAFLRYAAETFAAMPLSVGPAKPPVTVDAMPGAVLEGRRGSRFPW